MRSETKVIQNMAHPCLLLPLSGPQLVYVLGGVLLLALCSNAC